MKKTLLSALLFCSLIANAQVGIGVSVANIEPSAQLEVKSTNKGLLTPRMNEAQKNAINNPATGLLVYQTDGISGFYYYDGNAWKQGFGSQGATDTASLSMRINAKSSLSDTSLLNLTSRFEKKLNKTDTASLSNRINAKLSKTDTAALSDRINAKLSSTVFPYYPGVQKGHIMVWNGSRWENLNPGTAGQVLKMSSDADPVPVWGTVATTSTTAFSPCGQTITDIDGNSYNTVLIGSQCWTKENLRVRRYNNGTVIGFDAVGGSGGVSSTWQNSTKGLHAIYAHDSVATPSNLTKYGYLYNWYAAKGINTNGTILANDTLNICPVGWHVPTDEEWTTLINELGGEFFSGGMMKSRGTSYWNSPNTGATNESGFSALPGGYRGAGGDFDGIRNSAFFWSSTERDNNSAWYRALFWSNSIVNRSSNNKAIGACVRCIKN